jgi:CHAT domain-containing protein
MWQLEVVSGPHAGQSIPLRTGAVRLGRAASNDIVLADDATVSGCHAILHCRNADWTLEDCGSKNGSFLGNGDQRIQIKEETALTPGQTFYLGAAGLRILASAQPRVPPPTQTTTLRVDFSGERLRYHLWSPSATGTEYGCSCSREDLAALQRRVLGAVTAQHATGAAGGLDEVAQVIAQHLFPARLAARLAELEGQALVISHPPALFGVPWEMLPVAKTPLGIRLPLARQVVLSDQSIAPLPQASGPSRWLIIANPTQDLPETQEAAEALLDAVLTREADADVTFIAGERATRLDLLKRLEAADVVYYTGHAAHDPEDPPASGWRLLEGRLTGRDFTRLRRVPAFVFANACESGREIAHTSGRLDGDLTAGLAGSLLLAGVRHYLGTHWPVAARPAAVFGQAVLEGLLAGEEVAVAVQEARRVIREVFPGAPAWAAYALFGEPTWRLPGVSG